MHFATHLAATCAAAFCALAPATLGFAGPATAQGIGVSSAPKIGEMEVRAYEKIPKTKVAVQLTSDNHLARELRRQVMVRLSKRGNEVGFSGGNVMRMDVSYFDFSSINDNLGSTLGGQPDYAPPGSNPRMDLPSNKISRRDGLTGPTAVPTIRVTLTLYAKDGGKVLWTASGACGAQGDKAQLAGEAIVNSIFDRADSNNVGSAGCPF
jgi:hypothetical protein